MKKERIVLGGGCFWCIEAVYRNVKGVISAVSGYAGGARANPSYENVCSGATGHAEIVDISYDADAITLSEILDIFFVVHNPTTLNAQGADQGTQYRSVVYYANEEEKQIIDDSITKHQSEFSEKIVTEVSPLPDVFSAEEYHQNYYNQNSSQGYCQVVIAPKLQKFMTKFPEKLA
jgi:peptide-methionine (S)-S-oxide reductase